MKPNLSPSFNPSDNEPTEVVAARVRGRVLRMLAVLLAIPVLYAISLTFARGRNLELADCLPTGISFSTPLAQGETTVAAALTERGAKVQNGVLVDSSGRPIAFERAGANSSKSSEGYTVIEVAPQDAPTL